MNMYKNAGNFAQSARPTVQAKAVAPGATAMPSDIMPVTTNVDRNLAIFSTLKKKFTQHRNVIITPGYIRVEQAIVNGKGRYLFNVTKDTNSDTITEVKLDRNDSFVATHTGLFLMKRDTTIPGIEVLQTYPNPTCIPDVAATFKNAHLEAFYNGFLSVQVGQTVYIEKLDTRRFRVISTNIESATITKSSAGEHDGFSELTPQIEFQGDGKSLISIEAPINASALVANTGSNLVNYLVLMFRGFLVTRR